MSAILTLPITCVLCGQRRMESLRPADAWECRQCRAEKKEKEQSSNWKAAG